MFKCITFIIIYIKLILNEDDVDENFKKPYIKLAKYDSTLVATVTNDEFSDLFFYDREDDQGIVSQDFSYSEVGNNIVLMLPAQNIQRISFQFQSSCKLPIVYSVKKNNQSTFALIDDTKMEMYFTTLGKDTLNSASNGEETVLRNVQINDNYVDEFRNQEIVYNIYEVSRQIAIVCLVFDTQQDFKLEFKANVQKYQIQNQEKSQNMDDEDHQEFDLTLPPQTSYDVVVTTEANELKLTFEYDSDNLEYQVIQVKSDKSIEYNQQSVITVSGIGPDDVIKVLLMNTGNKQIEVFITAETKVNDSGSKFPVWAIVLITIVGCIILVVIIILIVICYKKKNKENKSKNYPEAPEEFSKEKAKIVQELPQNNVVGSNMVGSRVHYPEFKEDDQTNIDVFTVQLKEQEMNLEYPSNVIKEFSNENKQL